MATEWIPFGFFKIGFSADGSGAAISVPDNPNWGLHAQDLMGVSPCEQGSRIPDPPGSPPPPPPP